MIQVEEKINIDSLIEGDYNTFEVVVNTFKDKVINVCFSYVNNLADAEDIAQEVFIELYKSISNFKKQSSLSTWIYRIASNKSIDFLRNKKRIKRGSGKIDYLEDQNNNFDWRTNYYSTDDLLVHQQRKELLHQAIEKLATRQKEAFVLTQIEGVDQKTAAEILETSIKSIESLVNRAKKKLRKILEKRISEYF